MATNSQTAHSFAHNLKTARRGSNLHWTETETGARVIWSYGWFPLCAISGEHVFWKSDSRYSTSTARQASHVWHALTAEQQTCSITVKHPDLWAAGGSVMARQASSAEDLERVCHLFCESVKSGLGSRKYAGNHLRNAYRFLNDGARIVKVSTELLSEHDAKARASELGLVYPDLDLLRQRLENKPLWLLAQARRTDLTPLACYFWSAMLQTLRDWREMAVTERSPFGPVLFNLDGLSQYVSYLGQSMAEAVAEAQSMLQKLERLADRQTERNAEEARQIAERVKLEQSEKIAEQRPRFLAGEISGVAYGPAIIRLDRDRRKIQTSAGMTIDLDALSVRAMDALAYALEYPETPAPATVSLPVSGQSVSFSVRRDGSDLRVGCHVFSSADLELIRPVMAEALELAGGVA